MMLPSSWRPKQVAGLIRVGPTDDGGYVIPEVALGRTQTLISFGLSHDWRFEEDFIARTGCTVHCFDHTVTDRFWLRKLMRDVAKLALRPRLTAGRLAELGLYWRYKKFFSGQNAFHHRLMIGYDGDGSISLDAALARFAKGAVFLKCDIEGAEWRILDQILSNQERIVGVAIEFHDVDVHRERLTRFIRDAQGFDLVHIHANNWGGVDPQGDPLVLEMTFLRADLAETSPATNRRSYPDEQLDRPNRPDRSDIPLCFAVQVETPAHPE